MAKIDPKYIPVGQMLLSRVFYEVPEYQRDYAWGPDEINQFWDDLVFAIEDDSDEYFLGSMVLTSHPTERSVFEVVDGQQRLTTITLLLVAMSHFTEAESLQGEIKAYLSERNKNSKRRQPRIRLNENNAAFYNTKILDASSIQEIRLLDRRANTLSNRLLARTTVQLFEKLQVYCEASRRPREEIVDAILSAIDHKMTVIRIDVADVSDAFRLFETLNDRGLALTVGDLLKNYLLSISGKSRKDLLANWKLMLDRLDQIDTVRFIRHSWMAYNGKIRNKILYKSIKEKYKTESDALHLSDRFAQDALIYSALHEPGADLWNQFGERSAKIRQDISQLNTFGVVSFHPLLLAVYNKQPALFQAALRLITVMAFRYFVIGGGGAGNAESVIVEFTKKYDREGGDWNIAKVRNELDALYPSDETFETNFALKKVPKSSHARLVTRIIADHLQGQELRIDDNAFAVNLEHILPKKPSEDWLVDFPDGKAEDYVDRIGNMTLLERSKNTSIGNTNFISKRAVYGASQIGLNADVAAVNSWTPEAIDKRQRKLAQIAVQIWRYDI